MLHIGCNFIQLFRIPQHNNRCVILLRIHTAQAADGQFPGVIYVFTVHPD